MPIWNSEAHSGLTGLIAFERSFEDIDCVFEQNIYKLTGFWMGLASNAKVM